MRKWIDAVLKEGATNKPSVDEGVFGFLKSLGTKPAQKKAGLQQPKREAAPVFGKRTAAAPAARIPTPAPIAAPTAASMERALADVAQAVAWAGSPEGAKQAIIQAARDNGVSSAALAKAITPEMIRQWHRNV